jgi:hypothetical protein
MSTVSMSPFLSSTPPAVRSFITLTLDEKYTGGYILSDSLKHWL